MPKTIQARACNRPSRTTSYRGSSKRTVTANQDTFPQSSRCGANVPCCGTSPMLTVQDGPFFGALSARAAVPSLAAAPGTAAGLPFATLPAAPAIPSSCAAGTERPADGSVPASLPVVPSPERPSRSPWTEKNVPAICPPGLPSPVLCRRTNRPSPPSGSCQMPIRRSRAAMPVRSRKAVSTAAACGPGTR